LLKKKYRNFPVLRIVGIIIPSHPGSYKKKTAEDQGILMVGAAGRLFTTTRVMSSLGRPAAR